MSGFLSSSPYGTSSARPSRARRALLFITLSAAILSCALPLTAVGWWRVMAALLAAGGRVSAESGGAALFGAGALAALLAIGGLRWWRRRRRAGQTGNAMGPGLVGAAVLAAVVIGGEGLPALVYLTLFLVALPVCGLALPLLLVGLVVRGTRSVWLAGLRSSPRAGRLSVVMLVMSLGAGLVWSGWHGVGGSSWQRAGSVGTVAAAGVGVSYRDEGGFEVLGGANGFGVDEQAAFERCMLRLAGAGAGRTRVDDAIRRLQGRGTRRAVAEDVVYDALLAACEGYADHKVPLDVDLERWFNGIVGKMAKYEYRKYGRRMCGFEAELHESWSPSPELIAELLQVEAVLCELSPTDARILRLIAEGHRPREIAAMVGGKEDAVRQALKRARDRLRKRLDGH